MYRECSGRRAGEGERERERQTDRKETPGRSPPPLPPCLLKGKFSYITGAAEAASERASEGERASAGAPLGFHALLTSRRYRQVRGGANQLVQSRRASERASQSSAKCGEVTGSHIH